MAHSITWGNADGNWFASAGGDSLLGREYDNKAGTLQRKDFDLSNGIVAVKLVGPNDGRENFLGGAIIHNLQPPESAVQCFLEAHGAMAVFAAFAIQNQVKQKQVGHDNAQIVFNGLATWQFEGKPFGQAFEEKGIKVFVCQLSIVSEETPIARRRTSSVWQHVWLEFVDKATNPSYEPEEVHRGPVNCCVMQSGLVCAIL